MIMEVCHIIPIGNIVYIIIIIIFIDTLWYTTNI